MWNEISEEKKTDKHKSFGTDSKSVKKKIGKETQPAELKGKKNYPSLINLNHKSRVKLTNQSDRSKKTKYRSLSLSKHLIDATEKNENSHYISPIISFMRSKDSHKKTEKPNLSPRIDRAIKHFSIKKKSKNFRDSNQVTQQTVEKYQKRVKKLNKVFSTPRLTVSSRDPTDELKLRPKPEKKLAKKISADQLPTLRKLRTKPVDRKKSPDRRQKEKKKHIKKKSKKEQSKKSRILTNEKNESRNDCKKKKKVDLILKRSDASSSVESKRKFKRKLINQELLENSLKGKIKKQEINENIQSVETVVKFNTQESCEEALNKHLGAEFLPENEELSICTTPKKVNKIPIESFIEIIKEKYPSISIVENQGIKVNQEPADLEIDCDCHETVQIISDLEMSHYSESESEFTELDANQFIINSSNPSSQFEKGQFVFLSGGFCNDSSESNESGDKANEATLADQNFYYDEAVLNLISQEVSQFLEISRFVQRKIEVDPSSEFFLRYLKLLEKELSKQEENILSLINTPFSENPDEKLERIRSSQLGASTSVFSYERLLPGEIENELKDMVITFNKNSQVFYSKMLFDAVNEAANFVRPFGFSGIPDPWSPKFDMMFGEMKLGVVFQRISKILTEWETLRLGQVSSESGSSEALKEIEDKIKSALKSHILNEEEIWTDYEFEDTQVKIGISDQIFEYLVEESINYLTIN